jgi:kynurenine formamidase
LIGNAIKIDVSSKASGNPDYLISIEDIRDWEKEHKKDVPEGSIVLLQTGFSQFYPDKKKYLGTTERGEHAIRELHFPGLSPEAAQWLVGNRNISAIGIDTPSIDYGQSEFFAKQGIREFNLMVVFPDPGYAGATNPSIQPPSLNQKLSLNSNLGKMVTFLF